MTRRLAAAFCVLVLVISACSGGSTTLTGEQGAAGDEDVAVADPTEVPTEQPTEPPTPEPTATPPEPTVAPVVSWLDPFEIGSCFNNVGGEGADSRAGDLVDCSGEHENEIFAIFETPLGPGAPYPVDDDAFYDALFTDFCDPATIEFGGEPWDVLPFGTSVWIPTAEDWAAGDRAVACTAQAALIDENPFKIGTAAGGTLDSDEGIVARATVSGQRDYVFSFEGSTIYPLTNGEFDLPNTSPQPRRAGFLFSSPLQDATEPGAAAYDFSYDELTATAVQTDVPSTWETASIQFVLDDPAFVFAARENEDDDWDIYRSTTAGGAVALTDSAGDDRWPTLTPDETRIVYHSDGDIWIMNIDGTDKTQLTTDPDGDFESAVSPDGSQIAFSSNRSGNDDIWLMDIDGSNQVNLTDHPANDAWPFWSADGSIIYFQTDRLGARANIMMMETDGLNQSYFSFEIMTNAARLPDVVTERYKDELLTLAQTLEIAERDAQATPVVPGAEGETADIEHSSSRIIVTLPSGWEYDEPNTDQIAKLIAAPSLDAYAETWATDGLEITLVEPADLPAWDAIVDAAVAASDSSCTITNNSTDVNGPRLTYERRYSCGAEAQALVVAVYESERNLGILVEGQFDADPDAETDELVLTAIGESLRWG